MEYDGMTLDVVASGWRGINGGNNGSTAGNPSAVGNEACSTNGACSTAWSDCATGAGNGAAVLDDLFDFGFFLPPPFAAIAPLMAPKQHNPSAPNKSHW
jgi:hypothetical protein